MIMHTKYWTLTAFFFVLPIDYKYSSVHGSYVHEYSCIIGSIKRYPYQPVTIEIADDKCVNMCGNDGIC